LSGSDLDALAENGCTQSVHDQTAPLVLVVVRCWDRADTCMLSSPA